MPNAHDLNARRRRGTIQSVDRAARILKALASGPRNLGVSQLGDTDRILPRGPARGLGQAVTEAARSVSRELGAGRWPSA